MNFILNDWVNILLVITSFVAFAVYFYQKSDIKKAAATLIVLQITELRARMEELQPLMALKDINSIAIYESLPIIDIDYWKLNKHLFVKDIDKDSMEIIDKFYKYVTAIQEQQSLIKQQQKQHLFQTQSSLHNAEYMAIIETIKVIDDSPFNLESFNELMRANSSPQTDTLVLESMLKEIIPNNANFDTNRFWNLYNNKRVKLKTIINNGCFTEYVSIQTGSTASKIFASYSLLEIMGCEGYKKLCKIANTK